MQRADAAKPGWRSEGAIHTVLAVSGSAIGALVGFIIGVGLSVYVALLDLRKRQAGLRSGAQYRLSLFGVPLLLAGLGALIGVGISHLA
jgi:hypothetical protein